jgi:hypothetical protein
MKYNILNQIMDNYQIWTIINQDVLYPKVKRIDNFIIHLILIQEMVIKFSQH